MQYFNLDRFVEAQDRFGDFETAKQELSDGEKQSHWIWYIFPQIKGLGHSPMAQDYAIDSLFEACAYLQHPVLGARLYEISELLMDYNEGRDITHVMGSRIDAVKLKSSMTLFELAAPDCIFSRILDHFYKGERDTLTLQLLGDEPEWLMGKSAFYLNGLRQPTERAFLEGIDTGEYGTDQLLATNLDLILRGNSMLKLCMNHLVEHNDIFGTYRPHDIEIQLSAFIHTLFDVVLGDCGNELSDTEALSIKRYYEQLDNSDFEYCLEVAELFDEIVKFLAGAASLRGALNNYILKYSLLQH